MTDPAGWFADQGIAVTAAGPLITDQVVPALAAWVRRATSSVVGRPAIVGIAGSVASGKSYLAQALVQALNGGADGGDGSTCLTTDGFILPNAVLDAQGLTDRKGYPESYDWSLLAARLSDLREGGEAWWPTYSHRRYDRGDDERVTVTEVAVVEGVNILQPVESLAGLLDRRIYLDASEPDLQAWFVDRFLDSWAAGRSDPSSFYHQWSELSPVEAREFSVLVWTVINRPNLDQHILPSRDHADLVLHQRRDHAVDRVHGGPAAC